MKSDSNKEMRPMKRAMETADRILNSLKDKDLGQMTPMQLIQAMGKLSKVICALEKSYPSAVR